MLRPTPKNFVRAYSLNTGATPADCCIEYMASQSASQDENDSAFQQNAASRLSSFQSNAQGFSSILGQLAADKGLANYDKNNELETMLKDFVNANKDALSAVTTLSYNIPGLGPVLGPSE